MDKVALARRILLKLAAKKQAGIMLPLAVGAAAVGGAHMLGKGIQKGKEYQAGFQPGALANGSHG